MLSGAPTSAFLRPRPPLGLTRDFAQDEKGGGIEVGRQEIHTFFSNAHIS